VIATANSQTVDARFRPVAYVKMIPHQQQKRAGPGEFMRAINAVAITERLRLFNKMQSTRVFAGRSRKRCLISWENHDTDFVYSRTQDLFDDDGQRSFRNPVPVNKALQWKCALISTRRGDDSSFDFHDVCSVRRSASQNISQASIEVGTMARLIP
jgi:hypothetical protein